MNTWTRFMPAAMMVLFGLVAASIPSTTSTVEIRALALVREVQPTVTLAHGTRHANHKNHKNEDPGFAPIGAVAARPAPQVAL